MPLLASFFVLLLAPARPASPQPSGKPVSMAYTTAALRTLRCMREAVADVQALSECHESMNNAQDLMRSQSEIATFQLISRIGAAAAARDGRMREELEDFKVDFQAHHLYADEPEFNAGAKQISAKLMVVERSARQLDCMDDVSAMLRTGKMRRSSRCALFFSKEADYAQQHRSSR